MHNHVYCQPQAPPPPPPPAVHSKKKKTHNKHKPTATSTNTSPLAHNRSENTNTNPHRRWAWDSRERVELGGSAFEVENAKSGRRWAGLRLVLGWASIGTGQWGVVGVELRSNRLSREAGLIKMEDWKRKKEEKPERERKRKRKKYFFNRRGERNLIK